MKCGRSQTMPKNNKCSLNFKFLFASCLVKSAIRLKEEFLTNTTYWFVSGKCSCKNLTTWKYYDNSLEAVDFLTLAHGSPRSEIEMYSTQPDLDASRWVISFISAFVSIEYRFSIIVFYQSNLAYFRYPGLHSIKHC